MKLLVACLSGGLLMLSACHHDAADPPARQPGAAYRRLLRTLYRNTVPTTGISSKETLFKLK